MKLRIGPNQTIIKKNSNLGLDLTRTIFFSNLGQDQTRATKNLKLSDQFGPFDPWIPDRTNKCIDGHVSEVYFKLLIDHAVSDRVHT